MEDNELSQIPLGQKWTNSRKKCFFNAWLIFKYVKIIGLILASWSNQLNIMVY